MRITLNKIKEIANSVLEREYESLQEDKVKETMQEIVSKQASKLILNALGLEKSWSGDLSIRYDGSFRSNLKILTEESLRPLAQQIWGNIIAETPVSLSDKEKAHLRKAFRDEYSVCVEREIRKLAEEQASIDAPGYFEEYLKSLDQVTP
jgi:hypothetical protein